MLFEMRSFKNDQQKDGRGVSKMPALLNIESYVIYYMFSVIHCALVWLRRVRVMLARGHG
jgi:hypothetical protein